MIDLPDTWGKRVNAFGAMFVTATVFVMLCSGLAVAVWWDDKQLFANLMETVKALVMVAAGFWVGSSSNSQKKDETIAAAAAETRRSQG